MTITKDELVSTLLNLSNKISSNHLSSEKVLSYKKYFEVKYMFHSVENNEYLLIYLTFKHSEYVVAYIEYALTPSHVDINSYNVTSKNKRDTLILLPYMVNDLFTNNIDFVDDVYSHYLKNIERIKLEAEQSFYDEVMDISYNIDKKERINISLPVHIYPYFEDFEYQYALTFKIGRSNKTYVIKNIMEFISEVDNNVEKRFGKELDVVLDKKIFDEESAKLIDLIKKEVYHPGKMNDRYIELNDNPITYQVFNIYKDKCVYIDNEPYLVRMKEIEVKIHIDNNFLLSLEIPSSYEYESRLGCLIDKTNHIIDKIVGDEEYINLIKAIHCSDYPCISMHIDDFKYNIILRYINFFTYDEMIENEFKFEEISINVYFDIDKETIVYHDEIFDAIGVKIDVDSLNPYNKSQYKRYKHILFNYGFSDENKIEEPSKVWNFLTSDFTELKKVANVYLSDNIQRKVVTKFSPPQIRVSYNGSVLNVFVDETSYSEEDLIKIFLAIKHKKKYIFLKDNIINLDDPASEDFKNHVEEYDLLEKNKVNTYQKLPIYYAFKTLDGVKGVSLSNEVKAVLTKIKNFKNEDVEIAKINGTLREYQKDGVKWLTILYQNRLSGILADDMGLGKTIEIIAFLKGVKENKPILIVSPKSLIFNWINEFQKFDPDTKIIPIYGNKKEREKIINKINPNKKTIYITSYDSLRQDEDLYVDKEFEIMILDEAQAIKNSKAKKSITVTHIKSNVRFVLTGTPIENSILDLWSIFNFLMPGYLGDIDSFKEMFEDSSEEYKARLRKKISPFILRRNKKDVLKDLPPKYEVVISSEMNESQHKIYEAHRLEARNILKNGGKPFDVLYLLTRLRQICIDPSLFIDNYHDGSGKIDTLMEIIANRIMEGHRILIFSQFVKALELVRGLLLENNIQHLMITGKTEGEDRVKITNEFNTNKNYKIVLISLKAGGTGLNLIGADTVIHLDPWWNVAAQDQATDRAHRIGQEKNVEVIKLICENSIEQRVVELQNLKKELIESLISDDETSITNLSLEDIEFILK